MNNQHILISDGELYHWKYIKREKVNGKWRYYYTDDEYEKSKSRYDADLKNRNSTKAARDASYARAERLRKEASNAKKGSMWKTVASQSSKAAFEYGDSLNSRLRRDNERLSASSKVYQKAKNQYDKSAGHKVASFLNDAQYKIDKAKKWLSNLTKGR